MKVTVFGASGRTGSLVLEAARRYGWDATAFVRDASRFDVSLATSVVGGDARSTAAVSQAVTGRDAVFCCLGMQDITTPATDFSESVKTIVEAMKDDGVRRIVAIAAGGALDDPTGGYRSKGVPAEYANVAAEHVRNYETLRDSGLDWTLMCPLTLVNDIPTGHARTLYEDLPSGSAETGYQDLAAEMVRLVVDEGSHVKRVGIVSIR